MAGLLRTMVIVALIGAFTFFIIQAIMATYTVCKSVQYGLSTAATVMSYMGVWTLMVQVSQWCRTLGDMAPGLAPIATAAHGLLLDSLGLWSNQLALQPTPLPLSFVDTVDASQFTAAFGAMLSFTSCIIGRWG